MKKLFLVVLLGFLGVHTAWAQCQTYQFTEGQGTYAALSGDGVVVRTVAAGTALDFILSDNDVRTPFPNADGSVTGGIDLGFDFTFCEKVYDKVVITASGYLILGEKGQTEVAVTGVNPTLRQRALTDRAIGLVGTSGETLPQALEGTAYRYRRGERDGQKTFAVEFVKIGYVADNGTGSTSADLTYTVTLCEDKRIDFDFGDMIGAEDWYLRFRIGLYNTFPDMHFRTPKNDNGNWAATEMTTNTNMALIHAGSFPKGQHWTFSYPAPCEKPGATDLKVTFENVTATEFTYVVSSEEHAFDGVLVVFSTAPLTEADVPADGTVYDVDDNFGSGRVHNVGVLPLPACTLDADYDRIAPMNTYYITVFPYNNLCTGGIKYGPGVEGVCHTPTYAPEALTITAFDGETFELAVTKNKLNEDVAVVVTTRLGAGPGGRCAMIGQFGPVPEGVQAGDELETADGGFGGKVFYVGSGDGKITYGNLSPNTIYHFAAFSKGADGRYSIAFAHADSMTAPAFPLYEDFTQHPCNETPYKWADTKGFKRSRGDSFLSTNVNYSGGVLTTPEFELPAGKLRLVLEYYMAYVEDRLEYAYTSNLWSAQDSIVLEVSRNGGSFVRVAAITKANADDMKKGVFLKRNLAFGLQEAAPSRVRIRWTKQFEKGPTVQIQSVRLMAEPACDYPHEVTVPVAALTGSTAEVHWVPGVSEERCWNVSYARLTDGGEADWSEPREVDARPFTLRNLEAQTAYQVRVQAVCGIGNTSDWTYSAPFETNATIPMKEDFNTLRRDAVNRWTFNQGWLEGQADLKETVGQSDMTLNPTSGALGLVEWKKGTGFQSGVNGSVAYITSYRKNTWLMLPDLDFGQGGEGARLTFDVALSDALGNEDAAKTVKLYVFRSTDGGQTYRAADSLAVFDREAINAFGDSTRVTVPLDALQGHQRLAFFLTSQYDRYVRLYIDNVEVYAICATPKDLRYSNLTVNSVDLQWRADAHVASWVIKVESVNGLRLEETEANTYTLTGLSAVTAYKVSVGRVCAPADTVWSSVSFKTGGIRCDAVTGLTAEAVTRTTATLKWTGAAAKYNVQIAKKGDDNWTTYTTDKPAYAVSNLIPGTAYAWRVQSVCGEAVEDRSDYTAAVEFTTAATTCLPPTGLSVDEVSYYSVTLKWTATAGATYQVSFKKEKDLAYGVPFAAVENPLRITDLDAETSYQFRVRQVCGAGDTSAWSEPVQTATTVFIPCERPTNLKSESVTATSAYLSWKAEGNLSCILRYRASSATVWDSVKELTEQRYLVENLQPNTAYVWSVMSLCDNHRFSDWARQADFTTGSVANESALAKAFRVYASKGQLHILNPDRIGMERVELYDRAGRRMQSHVVRTTGNVVIPMTLNGESILVRVIGMDGRVAVYKIRL